MLVDIGVNLTHESFAADRDAVLARAAVLGVRQMIVTGTDVVQSQAAIALAHAQPGRLYATVGLHPHHAAQFDTAARIALQRLALDRAVVAVGECGLDYFRDLAPHAAQRLAFREQLEIAVSVGKPAFLHQRDAQTDFVAMLDEFSGRLAGGVAHCFTGERADLEQCLEFGLAIGITGWICDERRGAHLLELVRHIPPDRLLIETDAPYLLPRTLRPKPHTRRNEPAQLLEVLRVVAQARGESIEHCAALTTANARRLFNLDSIEI
jgi:TatD DNase family protein